MPTSRRGHRPSTLRILVALILGLHRLRRRVLEAEHTPASSRAGGSAAAGARLGQTGGPGSQTGGQSLAAGGAAWIGTVKLVDGTTS